MKDYNGADSTLTISETFAESSKRTLTVDVKRYQEFLDGSGLSGEQKEEFLRAVWSVVVTFVELGFGVHPLQEVCGKDSDSAEMLPKTTLDAVTSKDQRTEETYGHPRPSGSLEAE